MDAATVIISAAAVGGICAVHLLIGKMRFLDVIPRSRLLSFAGGASIAYVFGHILPDLHTGQHVLAGSFDEPALGVRHVYFVAMLGLTVFYGAEWLVRGRWAQSADRPDHPHRDRPGVFWPHVASFAVYNALIGYLLLHRERPGLLSLGLFAVAISLHFLATDFALRKDHKRSYDAVARFLLTACLVGGWLLGLAIQLPRAWVVLLFSFLAGAIIFNVLKEELPEDRRSRFGAFLAGVVAYSALIYLVEVTANGEHGA
jgi:zinc transporter ZupT